MMLLGRCYYNNNKLQLASEEDAKIEMFVREISGDV
jgi:hypothetical protein